MKQFDVSFNISSNDLGLEDLSVLTSFKYGNSSHELGSQDPLGQDRASSVLKVESGATESSSLDEHLDSLIRLIQIHPLGSTTIPESVSMYVDISVFFDSAMLSINLPSEKVQYFSGKGIDVEISCYPCDFPR